MKKYIFLLAVILGISTQAQELYNKFDASSYAKNLSEKIIALAEVDNPATIEKIEQQTYLFAMSVKKHILLYEKQGRTNGKTLDEVIRMVQADALNATKFKNQLAEILTADQMKVLEKEGLF
jgi:cytochrome c556